VLALGLAGCQTPHPAPESLATVNVDQGPNIAPAAPLVAEPSTPPPNAPVPAPTPAPKPVPAPAPRHPARPVNAWLPLDGWAEQNGLGKPARLPNPHAQYQLRTTNGLLSLKVGSQIARCDGLDCWLGYAPQFIAGSPHIHLLDARKNLEPLLRPAVFTQSPRGTIVLDPGHGGMDCGTRSLYNRQLEKDYTLDWALRLRPLLQRQGWNVVLTRTNDTEVSLHERVAIADRAQAGLFLSLHFNSGLPNRELAGIETYCLTPAGMPSNTVRSLEDDAQQVFPNNAFDEQNVQFAFRLHRRLIKTTDAPDHGLRRARFMGVLRGQHRPAVLIEGGYLSNLAEARKIATSTYRQALATAVASALEE
jgi:N-acetylmuramoyl-L-alanine amidase